MNLGDLIMAVSSCSKNSRETVAAVVDLLASGRVLVQQDGQPSRAIVFRGDRKAEQSVASQAPGRYPGCLKKTAHADRELAFCSVGAKAAASL